MNEVWWKAEKSRVAEKVFEYVNHLRENQGYTHSMNLENYRFYNDVEMEGLDLQNYSNPSPASALGHRVSFNIIKSMCDTVTATVTKSQPSPTFLTSGGSWSQRRKGELLTKFCQGQFYESNLYEIAPKVFLDACVFGTGIIKVYEEDGKIKCERIFPDEIICDAEESRYAEPRQLFQVKVVNKEVLKGLYPDKSDIIDDSIDVDNNPTLRSMVSEERGQLVVIEAWHLPSSKDSKDGVHSICVEGGCLYHGAYERDDFPFVKINWGDKLLGYWGCGLSEQLTGIQLEINNILKDIKEQMSLAKPKVFVETGSRISKAHLNNQIWGVIEYTSPGKPPQFYVPKSVSPEVFAQLDRLYSRAFQIAGVSEMTAQATRPVGLESAVALREMSDIQTRRFQTVERRYQKMFMDVAKHQIQLAREIVDRGDKYEVVSHGDKFIEKINWKDVDLTEDAYVMKMSATNLLPETPAGKLEFVRELAEAGLIKDEVAILKLIQYPDVEAVTQYITASHDIVDMFISEMLDKGIYHSPEPFMDLKFSVKRVNEAYLVARMQDAPEDRLDLLMRFIQEAMELQASTVAASLPPEGAMGPVSPGPMAPGPVPGEGAPSPLPAPAGPLPDDLAALMPQ